MAFGYYSVSTISETLPKDLKKVLNYQPARSSRAFAADGELIGEYFKEKRIFVSLDTLPPHVPNAFIAAEDGRFWDHPGYDARGIIRAAITNLQAGEHKQGASTITQQVIRNLLLTREKKLLRKIKELILSVRIEREISKQDILSIYINHVFLGASSYGVEAAAQSYFGKTARGLSVAEAALLAGLVQAPSKYSPHRNPKLARQRQVYVLGRMLEDQLITKEQHDKAMSAATVLVQQLHPNKAISPHVAETIRRWAGTTFGTNAVFQDGLNIFTTIDPTLQAYAEVLTEQSRTTLSSQFNGPLLHVENNKHSTAFISQAVSPHLPAIYTGARTNGLYQFRVNEDIITLSEQSNQFIEDWAKRRRRNLRANDLVAVRKQDQNYELVLAPIEVALFAVEIDTGRVVAMAGGDPENAFNHATQGRRQVGSSMKPFVYSTALARGKTQIDMVMDSPLNIRTASGIWSPGNYDGKYRGRVTLRTALAKSLNTVSVRLLMSTGLDALGETLRLLGITQKPPANLTSALGTLELSVAEQTAAYAAIANGGEYFAPRFVDYVTDQDGHVLRDYRGQQATPGLAPDVAHVTRELLQVVVERGTGRKAKVLNLPLGGKTGTTNDYRDAWFVGFSPKYACGVWVGRPGSNQPIGAGATGGSVALPVWIDFMKQAHRNIDAATFTPPADVYYFPVNENTGFPRGPKWLSFRRGTVPLPLLRWDLQPAASIQNP